MLRYLLDTNIVIYVLKRRPVEVLSTFNANASRMAISSLTLAELLHGAQKSSRVSENLAAIEDFCSRLEVLPYGPRATQHYGVIRAALEKLGQAKDGFKSRTGVLAPNTHTALTRTPPITPATSSAMPASVRGSGHWPRSQKA